MFILVSYDIPDNRRRTAVAGVLEGYGVRVQKSVFEAEVTAEQYVELQRRVLREIEPEEDGVRYYQICQACHGKIVIQGVGAVHKNPEFYFV